MAESPEPLDFLDVDHLLSDEERAIRDTVREWVGERVSRATLPNGKVIIAFARKTDPVPRWRVGAEETVLLSLCDFNEGRLSQPAAPPPLPSGATTASRAVASA